jgi:hypothetical protein
MPLTVLFPVLFVHMLCLLEVFMEALLCLRCFFRFSLFSAFACLNPRIWFRLTELVCQHGCQLGFPLGDKWDGLRLCSHKKTVQEALGKYHQLISTVQPIMMETFAATGRSSHDEDEERKSSHHSVDDDEGDVALMLGSLYQLRSDASPSHVRERDSWEDVRDEGHVVVTPASKKSKTRAPVYRKSNTDVTKSKAARQNPPSSEVDLTKLKCKLRHLGHSCSLNPTASLSAMEGPAKSHLATDCVAKCSQCRGTHPSVCFFGLKKRGNQMRWLDTCDVNCRTAVKK